MVRPEPFGSEPVLLVSTMPVLKEFFRARNPNSTLRTVVARSAVAALRRAGRSRLRAVVVDLAFVDKQMDGLELALNLRDSDRGLPVWVLAWRGSHGHVAIPITRTGRFAPGGRRALRLPALLRRLRRPPQGGSS